MGLIDRDVSKGMPWDLSFTEKEIVSHKGRTQMNSLGLKMSRCHLFGDQVEAMILTRVNGQTG